ncbi:flagellar export protein FliJ [Stutzerimonas azotifigens]|uniref:flagellar export protein FliJ n=1 Tax=Stutzerimonas azotifigens TaxID=291995 RepID=UPI00040F8735|nr:flagellar export protein FliJ [Stutzerimonas azotifigens]
MSSSRADRLAPVIEMAERAEREAAKLLGQGQTQLTQAKNKLSELEQYFGDYQRQWMEQGARGVSGDWLMNYQRFLSQLESAIGQQRRSVAWHENNLGKLRDQWQQRHARLEGLRKLVERYLREARVAADKREQRLLDEFSQRLASRSRHD